MKNETILVPERALTWRLAANAALVLRFWDDECVLYHGACGSTHRIPEPVGRLLECLEGGAATPAELAERIDLDEEDVLSSLQQMRQLGIAERVA